MKHMLLMLLIAHSLYAANDDHKRITPEDLTRPDFKLFAKLVDQEAKSPQIKEKGFMALVHDASVMAEEAKIHAFVAKQPEVIKTWNAIKNNGEPKKDATKTKWKAYRNTCDKARLLIWIAKNIDLPDSCEQILRTFLQQEDGDILKHPRISALSKDQEITAISDDKDLVFKATLAHVFGIRWLHLKQHPWSFYFEPEK